MSILPWIGGDEAGQENFPPEVDRSHDDVEAEAEDEEELEELEPHEPRPVATAQADLHDSIVWHPQLSGTS